MASTTDWDPDKMLRLYMLDYMKKRGMDKTAAIFQTEADVSNGPVAVQSAEGFLHEWWSIFYETYISMHVKHQETGPEASSEALQKANNETKNLPPRIPQLRWQISQQLQIDPNITNMMEQPTASRLPSHPQEDIGKQAQNPFFRESGAGIQLGSKVPMDPLDIVQRTIRPSNGPHETRASKGLNLAPLNERPLNVLTSLLQAPNYQQQLQGLETQNQQALLAQVLARTPKSQTSKSPGDSPIYNSQDLRIPLIESELCKKDRQDDILAADDRPVDDNVVSFLPNENERADQGTGSSRNLKRIFATCDISEGFSFEEVGCLHSSKSKVLSCHFSSDGKVLASAGHEKKVFVWNMETFDCVTTSDAHSLLITDVRFRPGSTIFATSSFDKTVKIWDAAKPNKSLFELAGHAEQVMSLDFHPRKVDLLCSCDSNDVIRLWNVNQGVCMRITKGGSKQVRFQPRFAKFLATATGSSINVIDIESDRVMYKLKGHVEDVLSICWDVRGNYIASVSEDSARVWSVMSDGECIQILHSNGNKFRSCIFHPVYFNLLIIGCYQSLEFWIPTESCKTWTRPAHKALIAGLGASPENQMVASASHDHYVKLWK